MTASDVFRTSDGALTRTFYAALSRRGPLGRIAVNLFRAQKCSARAKKYGPIAGHHLVTFRWMSYARKAASLKELTEILEAFGERFGLSFGWGRDEYQDSNKWVLYVDLPNGQVSFHCSERYNGPDYPGNWDGLKLSESRIIDFAQHVLSGVPFDTTRNLRPEGA